jgi:hypothetical protein
MAARWHRIGPRGAALGRYRGPDAFVRPTPVVLVFLGIYLVDPLRLDPSGQADLFAAQRAMDDALRWMAIFCGTVLLLLVVDFAVLVWTGEPSPL